MPMVDALATGTLRRILSFSKINHKQLKFVARNFLLFDGDNLSNAMGGIDDRLTGLETLSL